MTHSLLRCLVAACVLSEGAVLGFSTSTFSSSRRLPRSQPGPVLRLAAELDGDSKSKTQEALIRQIDQKIQRFENKQQKYTAQLDAARAELEKIQATKRRYLSGNGLGDEAPRFSETTTRSLVKALMWRVVAGCVTFLTALRFAGDAAAALSIVGSDFASKAATMFIGERLMNASQAGRGGGSDGAGRSLAKALLWRAFAIANTLTMSYLITKDLKVAGKVAGSDAFFKTGLMFGYERVWAQIEWGKEYLIEFSI